MEMKMALLFFFASAAVVFAVSAQEAPVLAPSPAAAGGGDDCTSVLVNLQDCLTYVTVGSNTKKPTSSCCRNLKTVVEDSPKCLCSGFSLAKQLGVKIDMTKASALPSSCKLSDASAATCSLSPAGAPTSAAVSPSASSPTPAGVSPSTVTGGSSASKLAFSLSAGPLLAALVLVVAYFSSF